MEIAHWASLGWKTQSVFEDKDFSDFGNRRQVSIAKNENRGKIQLEGQFRGTTPKRTERGKVPCLDLFDRGKEAVRERGSPTNLNSSDLRGSSYPHPISTGRSENKKHQKHQKIVAKLSDVMSAI